MLVGKTDGREISLLLPNLMRKPAEGVQPTKDPNGWGLHKKQIPLKEGINIIDVERPPTLTSATSAMMPTRRRKSPSIS